CLGHSALIGYPCGKASAGPHRVRVCPKCMDPRIGFSPPTRCSRYVKTTRAVMTGSAACEREGGDRRGESSPLHMADEQPLRGALLFCRSGVGISATVSASQ